MLGVIRVEEITRADFKGGFALFGDRLGMECISFIKSN